jgi:phage FluMu protein Com
MHEWLEWQCPWCKFLRRVETVGLKVNQFPFCTQLNKIIAVKVQECREFSEKSE